MLTVSNQHILYNAYSLNVEVDHLLTHIFSVLLICPSCIKQRTNVKNSILIGLKSGLVEGKSDQTYHLIDHCLFTQRYIKLYYGHPYLVQQHTAHGYILLCIHFSALSNHTLPHNAIYHSINYLLELVSSGDISELKQVVEKARMRKTFSVAYNQTLKTS